MNEDAANKPPKTTLEEEFRALVILDTVLEREDCFPVAARRDLSEIEKRHQRVKNMQQTTITDLFTS